MTSHDDVSRDGTTTAESSNAPVLRRSIGLPLLVLYGLGTTIGAGIYVLTGEMAAIAGYHAPIAFLGAAVLAGLSAGSFAELSSRFPRSAGEALYVREGFGSVRLGVLVGLLVVSSAGVSAAAISNGFAGYLFELWGVPRPLALTTLIVCLVALAAWGVAESVRFAGAITLIEILGLVLVLWATRSSWSGLQEHMPLLIPPFEAAVWGPIGLASILAFYAFLGFEDMVNMAEEVKDVERTLPLAIGITLVVTGIIYLLLGLAAVLAIAPSELAASDAPLALLYNRGGGGDPRVLGTIAIFAVVNGALVQIIMAARVLYGLSSQGHLPSVFSRLHPRTQTPILATVSVGVVVLSLALWLPLVRLAESTSMIAMAVFALVNLSLIRLHRRGPAPAEVFQVARWVPVAGALASISVLGARVLSFWF